MSIDLAMLEQSFRAMIRTLLGMADNSVRRANQFNPPPAGDQATPFATVLVTEVDGRGWDDVSYANTGAADVTESITGLRHFLASVQFFRGDAKSQAMRLETLLQSSNALAQLQAAGIGMGKIGAIRDLSKLTDTFFEQRAQLDLEFYVVNQEQVDLPTFGTFTPVSITTDFQ